MRESDREKQYITKRGRRYKVEVCDDSGQVDSIMLSSEDMDKPSGQSQHFSFERGDKDIIEQIIGRIGLLVSYYFSDSDPG